MDEETASSDRPGAQRWGVTLWAGVGVLVAGLGVLGYAQVVADGVYPTVGADDQRQYETWVVFGVAVGCAVSAVAAVAWVLAVARRGAQGKLTTYALPRFLAWVAALLLGFRIWSCSRSGQVGDMPFPGDRGLLVTSVCGFVLVGTVVVQVAAARLWSSVAAPRPCTRRDVVGFVAGVTAVCLAAGTVVVVGGEPARLDATTAAAVQAPHTVGDPTRVLWQWSGRWIGEVVAAGAGVVVTTGDGVVGLDGRTGQERWHYRRTDSSDQFLAAVDGGRGVIVSFDGRLHAFDAFTGELRWRDEETTTQTPPPWDQPIAATDSTAIRYRYSPVSEFAGTDVRTGRLTWRYASERPGCPASADAVGDTVIIEYLCHRDSEEELVGLDGATGEPLWRVPGGAFVRDGMVLHMDEDGGLLDPRSGRVLVPAGSPVAFDSSEIITYTGALFQVGDAAPRWEVPDTAPRAEFDDEGAAVAATFLDDAVVLANDRSCPGGATGLQLIVVDRADGTVRRSLDCGELPVDGYPDDVELISAPGAVVVRGQTALVAVG